MPPWRVAVHRDALPASLAEIAAAEAEARDTRGHRARFPGIRAGRCGLPRRARRVVRRDPDLMTGRGPWRQPGEGPEFDSALIADPALSSRIATRPNDLYVAMTRSTRRLGILHAGQPPAEVAELRTWHGAAVRFVQMAGCTDTSVAACQLPYPHPPDGLGIFDVEGAATSTAHGRIRWPAPTTATRPA